MSRKPAKSAPPPTPVATPDDQVESSAPAVFTVDELAVRWSMHRQTIMAAIHAGRLKAFKPSERHYRVTRAEVERFEAENVRLQAASA